MKEAVSTWEEEGQPSDEVRVAADMRGVSRQANTLLIGATYRPLSVAWSSAAKPLPTSVIAAIGPEGGFTDDEVQSGAASGWQTVDLGPRILRVETAALTVAAWISLASPGQNG